MIVAGMRNSKNIPYTKKGIRVSHRLMRKETWLRTCQSCQTINIQFAPESNESQMIRAERSFLINVRKSRRKRAAKLETTSQSLLYAYPVNWLTAI